MHSDFEKIKYSTKIQNKMKTKLFLGLIALGVLISACTAEELENDDYKLNSNNLETLEQHIVSTDSTSTTSNNNDFDTGEDDPIID